MLVTVLAAVAACDRSEPAAQKPTAPPDTATKTTDTRLPPPTSTIETTRPALTDVSPTTNPDLHVNPPVSMVIDQQRYAFPPAKLVVSDSDGHVAAILYSDDPKDAIKPEYTGNAFYISMPLDVPDVHQLNQAVWHFQTSSRERADTPFGVFLLGNRVAVQPLDVTVKFETRDDLLILWMTGTWLRFDDKDETTPPREIALTAMITPDLKVKSTDK